MQVPVRTMCLLAILLAFASTTMTAASRSLPACGSQGLTRHGNSISIGLDALAKSLNDKLGAAHSHFSDLQLTSESGNLKVSGMKNGTPISISGPLHVTGQGLIRLHANHIEDNGAEVEGVMGLFGKHLSDYVSLKKTGVMSVQGNDLRINPDKLLGLRGRTTAVKLLKSSIRLQFALQPCQ